MKSMCYIIFFGCLSWGYFLKRKEANMDEISNKKENRDSGVRYYEYFTQIEEFEKTAEWLLTFCKFDPNVYQTSLRLLHFLLTDKFIVDRKIRRELHQDITKHFMALRIDSNITELSFGFFEIGIALETSLFGQHQEKSRILFSRENGDPIRNLVIGWGPKDCQIKLKINKRSWKGSDGEVDLTSPRKFYIQGDKTIELYEGVPSRLYVRKSISERTSYKIRINDDCSLTPIPPESKEEKKVS